MTELLLIRHGLTYENLTYTLIGHTDPSLHEIGVMQGEGLAEELAEENLDAIFSSPLLRASQTGKIIAQRHKRVQIFERKDLSEINLGIVDGLSSFKAYEQYKDLIDQALDPNLDDFTFPGGEWRSKALHRFDTALSEIINRYPSETVCIVTHGGLIGLWLAQLHHLPLGSFRKWQPEHASITRVTAINNEYKLISFNKTKHLSVSIKRAIKQIKDDTRFNG